MASRRPNGSASSRELPATAVARQLESLQSAYAAWAELKVARAAAAVARKTEREKLETKASYLLNAVSAARAFAPPDEKPSKPLPKSKAKRAGASKGELVPLASSTSPLEAFHAQAEEELRSASAKLDEREHSEEASFAKHEAEVRKLVRQRAEQHLRIHRPKLALGVHPVGGGKVIVQAQGLGEEDAVLLLRVLFDRLPTRWGFFTDDEVDELDTPSARLYADEGVVIPVPATADTEDAVAEAMPDFAPVRLHLPIRIPARAFPRFRLIHRGPVAEVEARREGTAYQHVIAQEDAELLTGYLLSLKLRGLIEFGVEVG